MLEEISSYALAEWMAFFALEPFGYEANLAGHAVTSSVIANTNRKKGAKAFKPADFLPKERETKSADDFIDGLKQYFSAMKLSEKKKEKRKK